MSSLQSESIRAQVAELRERGFVVARGLVGAEQCAALKRTAERQLQEAAQPIEFEAYLRYPGAPESKHAPGGHTVRRLLDAYERDPLFAERATAPEIAAWMRARQHPAYGSLTGWHRDVRYWSFERPDLVSVWLALGQETDENGALWLVPGSHSATFGPEAFDAAKFFRSDLPENRKMIDAAVCPPLNAGDVVFFHCNTLHSAGQNRSDQVKFSLVFTYHGESNRPIAGSRSASKPEVPF